MPVDFDKLNKQHGLTHLSGTKMPPSKTGRVDFQGLYEKTEKDYSSKVSQLKPVTPSPKQLPTVQEPSLSKEDWNRVGGLPKLAPIYAGTGDTIKLMGGALDFASGGKYGGRLKKYGEEIARDFTDEEALSALGEFDVADLKNPSFWYQKGLRTIPNTVALLPAAIIGGYAGGATGAAIGLGAFGRAVLGTIGGAGLSRTVEGAMEASGTYDEAKLSGMDEESARAAASIVFRNNYKLAGLDAAEFASVFLPTKYLPKSLRGGIASTVTKIAANVGMEGGEEVYQNKIGSDALGKEFDVTSPENRESFVLGGAMGGLFGSGGVVIEKLHTNFVKNLPKEEKESFETAKNDLVLKGVDPKEAEIRALDSVIEESSPEMEGILKKSVAETVEQVTTEVEKMKQETIGKTVSNKDMTGIVQEGGTVKLDTPIEIGGRTIDTVPLNSNWSERPIEKLRETEAKMARDSVVKDDIIKISESIPEKKAVQPKAEKPVVAKPPVAEPVKEEEAPVINFDMGLDAKNGGELNKFEMIKKEFDTISEKASAARKEYFSKNPDAQITGENANDAAFLTADEQARMAELGSLIENKKMKDRGVEKEGDMKRIVKMKRELRGLGVEVGENESFKSLEGKLKQAKEKPSSSSPENGDKTGAQPVDKTEKNNEKTVTKKEEKPESVEAKEEKAQPKEKTEVKNDTELEEPKKSVRRFGKKSDVKNIDVGEKIGGARKDLYQETKDSIMKEYSASEIADLPREKAIPTVDYQSLIANGTSEDALGTYTFFVSVLGKKIRSSRSKFSRYIQGVQALRTFAQGMVMNSDRLNIGIEELVGKDLSMAESIAMYKHFDFINNEAIRPYSAIIRSWRYSKDGRNGELHHDFTLSKNGSYVRGVSAKTQAEFYTKVAEYLSVDKKARGKSNIADGIGVFLMTAARTPVVGYKKNGKFIKLEQFKTTEEARAAKKEKIDEYVKKVEEFTNFDENSFRGNENTHVGKSYRDGRDVSAEEFMQTFGFRGVEFGNWVTQDERIPRLNMAFDSFKELAIILGIPDSALSLNGELGFAFGSRGVKGALAHYEPDKVVINITKENGAGTIAHEWWHALDNYLSRKGGRSTNFVTGTRSYPREALQAEINNLMDFIKKSDVYKRSRLADGYKGKTYYVLPTELGARAFEVYVKTKMLERGSQNDFLVNVSDIQDLEKSFMGEVYPYAVGEEATKLVATMQQLVSTLQVDESGAVFSKRQTTGATITLSGKKGEIDYTRFSDEATLAEMSKTFEEFKEKILKKNPIASGVGVAELGVGSIVRRKGLYGKNDPTLFTIKKVADGMYAVQREGATSTFNIRPDEIAEVVKRSTTGRRFNQGDKETNFRKYFKKESNMTLEEFFINAKADAGIEGAFAKNDRATRGKDGRFTGSLPDTVTDKEIEEHISYGEAFSIVKRIQKETNPALRSILQFKIAEQLMVGKNSRDYVTDGYFSSQKALIAISTKVSSKEFEYVLRHEINHAAFALLSRDKQMDIEEWYLDLAKDPKREQEFVAIYDGKPGTVQEYLDLSKKNIQNWDGSRMSPVTFMADETFNRYIHKLNGKPKSALEKAYQDIVDAIFRLLERINQAIFKNRKFSAAAKNRATMSLLKNVFNEKGTDFVVPPGMIEMLRKKNITPGKIAFGDTGNGSGTAFSIGQSSSFIAKRLELDSPKFIIPKKRDRYQSLMRKAAEILNAEVSMVEDMENIPKYFDEMEHQYNVFIDFFKRFKQSREALTSYDVEGIKKRFSAMISATEIDNMLYSDTLSENEVLDDFRKTLEKENPALYYGERKVTGKTAKESAIERLENGTGAYSKDYQSIMDEVTAIDTESKGYRSELAEQLRDGSDNPFTYTTKNLRELGIVLPRKTVISKKQIEKQKANSFKAGVKKGFNIGAKTGMQYMRGIAEDKALSLQEKKDRIVKYAETSLPIDRRGRLLKMITRAKTEKDVMKAIGRIDRVAEQARSQAIIAEIKKVVSRVMKTESIDIGYKERISALIDGFNLTNKRRDTIDRISATKQYIARQKAEGKQVDIPARVQKAIEDLDKTLISSMNEADLINLLSEIAYLEEIGKNKLKTRRAIYEMKRDRMKEEVIENTVRMEMNPVLKSLPGEKPLTIQEKLQNFVPKTINFFSKVDKYISPVDVIFDILDGSQGFAGANYRLFKRNLDVKFGLFLDRKDVHQAPVKEYVDKHKMTVQQFERIGIHAARVQEGGMEKLANLGLTEEYIDGIELTDVEMNLYILMRKNLDDMRPEIERIMRTVYNKPLAKVDNYFSFMTDFEKVSDVEVLERIVNAQEVGQGKTKTVKKGFTLKRTGPGGQKIMVNAMEIYLKHTENASYLVEMAESIKMLSEIANSKEYLEASGEFGAQLVREWLDTMARKGGLLGDQQIEWLDKMRVNLGAAVLGFKLTAALIQPTALFNGAALIGNYAFIGARNITDQNWRTFLKQFPELRDRMADDPSYLESGFKSLEKVQRVGYMPLQKLDSITASAIVAGAYQKYMEENGKEISIDGKPDTDGVNYAEMILRRTQSSAFFKDIPLVLTRGKVGGRTFTKALLQFQNFLLNAWSLLRHEGVRRGIGQKRFTEASRIFMWTGVSILVSTGIREGIKQALDSLTGDDDDKKTFAEKYVREALGYIPFVSQGISVYSYGSFPVPALSIIGDVKIAAGQIEGKRKDTKMRGWIRAGAVFGKLFGIPGTVQTQSILTDLTYK